MRRLKWGAGLVTFLLAFQTHAGNRDPTAEQGRIFAQIDDLSISQDEFEAIFQAAVRHKYYHGKVPAEALEKFRKQVADDIVTQTLVYNQALLLGLQPDRKKIDEGLEAYNLNNTANQDWESRREKVIPRLIERLERQGLIEKMAARIRDVPWPQAAQVKQYYLGNPDKFTEPKRYWVSVILLKVPPAAAENKWLETKAEMSRLKQRIESGEDFALLAKEYSAHPSAVTGGDLGYLHQGVLDPEVQKKIEALAAIQLSDPIRVLEGFTLFQLNGVQAAQLKSFEEVKTRAADLLYREIQNRSWEIYVEELRSSANVYVNE